jgi:hypothetical protein
VISIQKKFLFIHVPRTAGNSIQHILKDYSEDRIVTTIKRQDGVERFGVRNDKYHTTKHSTLSQYREVLEPELYRGLFKFATIRNPWDRMISWYFLPRRGVKAWNREDFVKLVQTVPLLSQYVLVDPSSPKYVKETKIPENLDRRKLDQDIDFLMRFENLDEDFRQVCHYLDIPYTALPVRNKSTHEHYSHYYDEDLRERVREKFIEEIKFAHYEFEYA